MKKLIFPLFFLLPFTVSAQVLKVQQFISTPYQGVLMSTSTNGNSYATASSGPTVAFITATSTTATSTFQKTSITGAISLLGEYFTNFTTYVRSLFSATAPITLSGGGVIACNVASGSQPGCLASADWTTFNNKQAAGNYITALTGDVTASGPGSAAATLATVNGNVGSFTNTSLTVNAKGLITAASSGSAPEVPLTFTWPLIRTTNTISFGGLSTTTNLTTGHIPFVSGANTFSSRATTSVICSGTVSCSTFDVLGASPITITGSGGGGSDPFSHFNGVNSATTTSMAIGTSTAFNNQLTVSSSTAPQLSLSAGAGVQQWTMRNAGGDFFLSTTSVADNATSSIAALSIVGSLANIGIGTNNPTDVNANSRLTVAGPGSQDIIASTTDNTTLSDAIIQAYAPGSRVFMGAHGTNQVSTRYGITLGGWGEIGAFNSTFGTTNGLIVGTNPATPLVFGTGNIERMRFLGTGEGVVGTTTSSLISNLTISSSTAPQLTLSAGAGVAQWAFRNAGGSLYLSTTTIQGNSTTTIPAIAFTGNQILIPDGSAAAPSLSFLDDTNNGIGSPANDIFAIYTNGLERFRSDDGSAKNMFGTSTASQVALTLATSTVPQLSLSAGAGNPEWTERSVGGNLYFATSTGSATSTTALSFQSAVPGSAGLLIGTSTLGSTGLSVVGTVFAHTLTTAAGTPSSICQNATTKEITVNAALTCTVSSIKFKDIKGGFESDEGLARLLEIEPVEFAYKDHPDRNRWGFIAEQVAEVDEKLGDGYDEKGNPNSIDQNAILAVTVKAVQELALKTGAAKKTAQDHWQWAFIIGLIVAVSYQQIQIRNLKKHG